MTDRLVAIGVDVGGSGIKVGAVDAATGQLLADRLRVATPNPSTPAAVVRSIARLVKRAGAGLDPNIPVGVGVPSVVIDGVTKTAANIDPAWIDFDAGTALAKALKRPVHVLNDADAAGLAPNVPVGVGVPSVVIDGVTKTAANIDPAWIDFDAGTALAKALKRPVHVLNDADAAGLAEMRFGAGTGRGGVVLVLTLGTGVGSGLFVDGHLVPNTELGHMEIRGRDAERRSAAAARTRRGLSWKAWTADLDEHLHAIDKILWPGLIIVGGGVSKRADKFVPFLTVRPPVVPATLQNDAGIVGAALAASEREEKAARAGR